jgi:RecB family exonuclease
VTRRLLTASALQRYDVCPGSAVLPRADSVSEAAHKGHVIHAFLEAVPQVGRDAALAAVPLEYRAACEVIELDELPLDALRFAQEVTLAYDVVTGRAREIGRGLTREQAYADLQPTEIGGTADVVGLSADGRTVVVLDYKTGYTKLAEAERNWQLRFLSLASTRAYGAISARVGLIYVHDDEEPDYHPATLDPFDVDAAALDLRRLYDRVEFSARAVEAGELPLLTKGAHCRYCPCLAFCPAQTTTLRLLAQDPNPADFRRPVTNDDAARAWIAAKALHAALDEVNRNLSAYAIAHGIRLPNGNTVGLVETTREKVDGEVVRHVLAERFGTEVAEQACRFTSSKKAIKDALRPVAKSAGSKLAPLEREVLAAVDAAGGISVTTSTKLCEHAPSRELADQIETIRASLEAKAATPAGQ